MRGPDSVLFGTAGDTGAPPLLVGVEDQVEAALRSTDSVLTVASGTTSVLFDVYEPANLLWGPGGGFGTDLYYTARSQLTGGPPNELRLFHWNGAGNGSFFAVTNSTDAGGEVLGAAVFAWAHGGALGTDMYLGTVNDPTFTPGSFDALYRVHPNGKAELIANYYSGGLAPSPAPTGPYGDFLYSLGRSTLDRVDAFGTVTPILTGLDRPAGILFGPDDTLYVAETGAARIWKVTPCR
jgi:hypothetical protein